MVSSLRSLAPPTGNRKHNPLSLSCNFSCFPTGHSSSSVFLSLITCSSCSIYLAASWLWKEAKLCGRKRLRLYWLFGRRFLTLNCFLRSQFLLSCTFSTDTPTKEHRVIDWEPGSKFHVSTADFFAVLLFLLFLTLESGFQNIIVVDVCFWLIWRQMSGS